MNQRCLLLGLIGIVALQFVLTSDVQAQGLRNCRLKSRNQQQCVQEQACAVYSPTCDLAKTDSTRQCYYICPGYPSPCYWWCSSVANNCYENQNTLGTRKFCTEWAGHCTTVGGQVVDASWYRDCRNCKVAGGVPYDCSSPFREHSTECHP